MGSSSAGFIKALRDAHRWLDELLVDPTQTIELLAVREGKSERSIRMTLSLAFISPVLAEAAMGGGSSSARVLRQAPDRPADAVVRAMARPGTAGANSAAGRTQLIDATAIHCNPSSALNLAKANPRLRPLHKAARRGRRESSSSTATSFGSSSRPNWRRLSDTPSGFREALIKAGLSE